jgi:hypothetical protein
MYRITMQSRTTASAQIHHPQKSIIAEALGG